MLGCPGVTASPVMALSLPVHLKCSVYACAPTPSVTDPSDHGVIVPPEWSISANSSPSSSGKSTNPTAYLHTSGIHSIISAKGKSLFDGGQSESTVMSGAGTINCSCIGIISATMLTSATAIYVAVIMFHHSFHACAGDIGWCG